jgi:Holliday junction resolvasome RuvABC endonuclease subunit
MQQAVMERLSLPAIIKSDDANDAVAMGLCYVLKELC